MRAFGLADEQASAALIEIPTPEPGPGEVRVGVRASSVNGFDVFVATGMAKGMMEHRYPVVIGKDYAGVVDAVGEGVTAFVVGDEVAGITPGEPYVGRGTYAESVVVPAEGFIERKPAVLDFGQAASTGLAAVTGLACVDAVEPSEGDVVLVVGAAGGVGSYAVQMAAVRGARVVATAGPEDEAWIRELGASDVVDYTTGDATTAVREMFPEGVDALIVAVQLGDAFDQTAALVKGGGRLASTVGGADAGSVAERGLSGTNVLGQADPGSLGTVLEMAAEGMLRVPITRTFAFDELPQALRLVGEHRSRGKFAVMVSA